MSEPVAEPTTLGVITSIATLWPACATITTGSDLPVLLYSQA